MTSIKTNSKEKAIFLWTIIALVTFIAVNPAQAAGKSLNIRTWCDHTDPNLLKPFEQKHGVWINIKGYDGTGSCSGAAGAIPAR